MADVFLSYSRKDELFVRKLHKSLGEQKRDVWVDWEDIPLSSDWWGQICQGIENANTFVFIVTPDSLTSVICNLEIAHARKHNKRLIPIVRNPASEAYMLEELPKRPVDANAQMVLAGRSITDLAKENWNAISKHNWIFFADDERFDENFALMIKAIETDLNHVRTHTRLTTRAREWELRQKGNAYLLNGGEIREYTEWVKEGADKEPKPTELQLEYLFASQQAQARRTTFTYIGLMIGLVVAGVLIALSYLQNQQFEASQATRQAFETNAVFAEATNLSQNIILTDQKGTSEANFLVLTAQIATNQSRLTVVAQDQQDRLQQAQQSFATLTQQSQIQSAATGVAVTLGAVIQERDQAVATNSLLTLLVTQLAAANLDARSTQVAFVSSPTPSATPSITPTFDLTIEAFLGTRFAQQPASETDVQDDEPSITPSTTPSPTETLIPSETPTVTPSLTPLPTATFTPTQTPEVAVVYTGEVFVSPYGNDNNSCYSSTTACLTITRALAKAQPNATLRLDIGFYNERVVIDKSVAVIGAEEDLTILNGNNEGTTITIAEGVRARIENLTITGGANTEAGGGIVNFGELQTTDITITGNNAEGSGGGIANFGRWVALSTNVNNNIGQNGGGIYNAYGSVYVGTSMNVSNNTALLVNAQGDSFRDICPPQVSEEYTAAIAQCSSLTEGQACVISPNVATVAANGARTTYNSANATFALKDVATINLSALNSQSPRGSVLVNGTLEGSQSNWVYLRGGEQPNFMIAPEGSPTLSQLRAGGLAIVNVGFADSLRVRENPSLNAVTLTQLPTGTVVILIESPRSADGFRWWRVLTANGISGWSAESVDGTPLLLPLVQEPVGIGGRYTIYGTGARGINLRSEPRSNAGLISVVTQGFDVYVLDGPIEADGFTWWYVRRYNSEVTGWIVESIERMRVLVPTVLEPQGLPTAYAFDNGVCTAITQNPLVINAPSGRYRPAITTTWDFRQN